MGEKAIVRSDAAFRAVPPEPNIDDDRTLVEALAAYLTARGERVVLDYLCAVGIADVVTENAVYVVKTWLTSSEFFKALGEVLLYRQAINPALRPVIVGFVSPGSYIVELTEHARQIGVTVLLGNERDDVGRGDPPW